MAAGIKSDQRITRLAPLAEVLAHIDAHVKPIAPTRSDAASAYGKTLSEDAVVAHALPARAIALRDGYAVESEAVRDASSYAPVTIPVPTFVDAGAELPHGADAILPQETVVIRGSQAEISSPATPGDSILPEQADAASETPLLKAGTLFTATNIAILRATKIVSVDVRAPRVAILCTRNDDNILAAAMEWIGHAITAAGGEPIASSSGPIASILNDDKIHAAIMIGGTGAGQNDNAVTTFAQIGEIAFHGIAIVPGDTTALGFASNKPALLIPGRLDAALACWLLLGEPLLARLSGRPPNDTGRRVQLTRKIASSLGMTELIPVSCKSGEAEPLASGYLSLQALGRADGWISVPAQSEGYPAGSEVIVRPLP